MIYKEKDLEDIVESKSREIVSKEIKEKFDLLMEILDRTYLTEDSYANDIVLRDDILKAMEEVIDGSYKEHETCYNCKRNGKCKYTKQCKNENPFKVSSLSYFERKE